MATTWTITDAGSNTYTVDAVSVEDGWPDFQIGQNVSLELIFDSGSHESDYKSLKEFGEFLFDGATQTGVDYRQVPYYREYKHAQAPSNAQSYLWKLEPDSSIDYVDPYWVLLTDMTDNTLYSGAWEKLEVELFVIAPTSEGNRSTIQNEYEV